MGNRWRRYVAIALLTTATPLLAQTDDDEDDQSPPDQLEELLVTGVRVTAGGAQDVAYARSEILSGRIPHPNTFTDEGLLSQHDLTLPNSDQCDQLFCLFGEAARSDIVNKPNDLYFAGLGFSTNIDAGDWQREPQNIVAVVDKSGSMDGTPLALVRRSLLGLTNQLTGADQLSIVLYGDRSHVYLEPTRLTKDNVDNVRRLIKAIESAGSTNMEEGLEVGYRLARQSQAGFDGSTRVILFTDERPNVGDTSAAGFIGMAKQASGLGIGLTTIGVGVQFDSSLAIKLSSTRGGNLFFLPDATAADKIFDEEFDYLVSELAHDVTIVLRPHSEFDITGVYGLPGDVLSWSEDRAVSITIPTVFLSSRGGGVFVSLAPTATKADLPAPSVSADSVVLAAAITYVAARGDGAPATNTVEIAPGTGAPSYSMQLASLLVDEYLGLRLATTEHYVHNNQEGAYQAMRVLDGRFSAISDRKLKKATEGESDIVVQLLDQFAFLSGHESEVSTSKASHFWGLWRITEADTEDYWHTFEVGHYLLFSPDGRFAYIEEEDCSDLDWGDSEPYVVAKSGLLFVASDTLFKSQLRRNKLTLRHRDRAEDTDIKVVMEFAGPFPTEQFRPEDFDEYDEY